jgi:hypothetical protein
MYEVLLKIASDRMYGYSLSELCTFFSETKLEVASAMGELELIGAVRGLWIKNKDNRYERRYFTENPTPSFDDIIKKYKQRYGSTKYPIDSVGLEPSSKQKEQRIQEIETKIADLQSRVKIADCKIYTSYFFYRNLLMRVDKAKDGAETLHVLAEWIKESGELYKDFEEYLGSKNTLKAVKNDWSYIPTLTELEDFYNGVCSNCHGKGKIQLKYREGITLEDSRPLPDNVVSCPECKGTGKVNTKC